MCYGSNWVWFPSFLFFVCGFVENNNNNNNNNSMASVDKQLLGTETAQSMRCKGVKSIICGLSANDIRDSFLCSGADDFMLKPMPCKPNELREVLGTLIINHTHDRDLEFG